MITRADIDDRVRLWGLREDVVEKDYVLGWVLWGIGTDPLLHRSWVFKGGTCLKKCYIETYRFSEDLDFTVLEDGPIGQAEVLEAISSVLDRVNQESGVDFALAPPVYLSRPLGRSAEVRVYYRGPRNTPGPARIKFDLTMDEKVVCPPVLRPVSHDYPDALPPPGQVRNDELEIQSASYRILDDLAAAVHYGVATRDALSLMLGGIRSRRLANRVAESRAQAHLESLDTPLRDWLARKDISTWRSNFDASPTEVADLLAFARDPSVQLVDKVLEGEEYTLPYVERAAVLFDSSASLVYEPGQPAPAPLAILVNSEIVGTISPYHQDDVALLTGIGIPLDIRVRPSTSGALLMLRLSPEDNA